MRTYEDILADYLETKEGDELIEKSHHIYGYRNEEKSIFRLYQEISN